MNKTPMVSVIMSVYNDEENVANSIKSILNQTYSNYEFIIMDDGSLDGTWEILKTYQANSNKIKLLKNKKNIGLTKSLNKLLAESQGDYIARQDSDDFSLRGRMESQISFIEEFNLHGCSTRSMDKDLYKFVPRISHKISPIIINKIQNPFIHGSLIIEKQCIDKVGGYNNDFYYSQDYKLTSDLLNHGYKIKILNDIYYLSNFKDNISTNHKSEQSKLAKKVRRENLFRKKLF
jgi:glycosyltransferase involved in cell wall biosynthesis